MVNNINNLIPLLIHVITMCSFMCYFSSVHIIYYILYYSPLQKFTKRKRKVNQSLNTATKKEDKIHSVMVTGQHTQHDTKISCMSLCNS